jgi:hypothetical protein
MPKGFLKMLCGCIVGGRAYEPGELVEADRETARELLTKGLAVPAAAPGRTLTSDTAGGRK